MKSFLLLVCLILYSTSFPQELPFSKQTEGNGNDFSVIARRYAQIGVEDAFVFISKRMNPQNTNHYVSHFCNRIDYLISKTNDITNRNNLIQMRELITLGLNDKIKFAEELVKLVKTEIAYMEAGLLTVVEFYKLREFSSPTNVVALTGQILKIESNLYNTTSYTWYGDGAYPGSGYYWPTNITVKNTSTGSGDFFVSVENEPSGWDMYWGNFPYPNSSPTFTLGAGATLVLSGDFLAKTQSPNSSEQSTSCIYKLWEDGFFSNTLLHTFTEAIKNDVSKPTVSMTSLPNTQTSTSINVQWSGFDPGTGASGVKNYDIQSAKNNYSSWSDWKMGTTSTNATFSAEPGNTYYFRSRATDNVGHVSNYPSSYLIKTEVLCAPPVLYAPINGFVYNTSNGIVNFIWYPSLNANDYFLQVSRNSSFSDLMINQPIGTGIPFGDKLTQGLSGFLNNGQSYWWRIKAKGPNASSGYGEWSTPGTFKMDQVYTLNLTKSGDGGGSIKVNGVSHTLPYSESFSSGTSVSLQAIPDAGTVFTGWGGNLSGTSNPTSITMNANKDVTVKFYKNYTLTISKTGTGSGTVKVNGASQSLPYTGTFVSGTSVTLQAEPAANSTFTGWGGDLTGTANPTTITMNSNKNVTAGFDLLNFTLTISKTGTGNGTVKVNGASQSLPYTGTFVSGTSVTLQAEPAANSTFTGWGGDLTGTANPTTITMNSNKNVTAGFDLLNFTLTISKTGTGNGTVKVNGASQSLPYTGTFVSGTSVTLQAEPSTNSTFTGWGGDLTGTANPTTITMNSNKNVTAGFDLLNFTLTISKTGTGNGTVKVNGASQSLPYTGTFVSGTSVTLQAEPATNSTFTGWGGDLTGTSNPTTITMNSVKNVTAGFDLMLLTTTPDTNYVSDSVGQAIFNISSNTSWSVSTTSDWVTSITPQNHSGDGQLIVGYSSNTTSSSRICSLRVEYGTVVHYLFIVQAFTSVREYGNGIPETFNLSQNYPNPFNPTTIVRFAIPKESTVKIELFSSQGELVNVIESSDRKPGYYEVDLNMSNLASGIYLYRITAIPMDSSDPYIQTKKFVLMK